MLCLWLYVVQQVTKKSELTLFSSVFNLNWKCWKIFKKNDVFWTLPKFSLLLLSNQIEFIFLKKTTFHNFLFIN